MKQKQAGSIIFGTLILLFWSMFAIYAENISTGAKIKAAYQSGSIDRQTYIVEKLKSYFSPTLVNPNLKGSFANKSSREITMLLTEARLNFDSFSKEEQIFLMMLLKRPTDTTYKWPWDANPLFYLPAPVSTFEPTAEDYANIGGKFKFHYVTHDTADGNGQKHTTTLEFVKKMASAFNTVYSKEITDMKYAAPPNDPGGADYGGDSKFDVYVMNCGFGSVYGYVSAEGADAAEANSYYSFMVMDNDFTEFVTATITAEDAMKVTAAHEYNHAVQNGINVFALSWYKEATSTWMEDQVYDSINDNRQYLKDFFDNPDKSLDSWDGYSSWIFNEYLGIKLTESFIKTVWDQLDPVDKDNPTDAITAALTAKSKTLKDAFTEFAAMNYSKEGYTDAVYYKTNYPVKIVNSASPHKLDFSTDTSHKIDEQTANVDNLAVKYYKFVPGADLHEPTLLTISVDGADSKDVNAVAVAKLKNDSFTVYNFTLDDTTKKGEIGVSDFGVDTVKEVVLALVNYSKADDNVEIKYKAELMKGFVFVIDDTGSMGTAISSAKAAANKVLTDNKAAGVKRFYSLISFKDGPGTLRGQSSDEDTMTALINALSASGGGGLPESSLTAIRKGAGLSSNSDILMMTDAPSNSYGVDYTTATWGEVFETIAKLLDTNCRLHCIYYGGGSSYPTMKTNSGAEINYTRTSTETPSSDEAYSRVSSVSGGLYFNTTTSATEDITEIILRSSTSNSTIAYYDATDSQTFTIPVDSTVTQLQLILNGETGSSLTLAVTNPSSTTVDNNTSDVSVIESAGTTTYIIGSSALASGNWTATVTGTGGYNFRAEATTTNSMVYTGDTAVGLGDDLNLETIFRETISGLTFQLVATDGSGTVDLSLSSSDNLTYAGTQTMSTAKSYRLKVSGSSNFQRMTSSRITVSYVSVIAPDGSEEQVDSTVTKTFKIENLGSTTETYTIYASSSQGWSDISSINGSTISLAAGASEDISITVTIPASAEDGTVEELSVQAVSSSDTLVNSTATTDITASDGYILTITQNPTDSGSVTPTSGTKIPANEAMDIIASPNTGYLFSHWSVPVGSTAVIADVSSSATTVTISEESTITANFAIEVDIGKLTAGLSNIKTGKDKIAINKAGFPMTFTEINEDSDVYVFIDGYEFPCIGIWKESGKDEQRKFTFKSDKDDPKGKYQLILDFKKGLWTFKATNATLFSSVGANSSITVVLQVDDNLYGKSLSCDDSTSWKYAGKKNGEGSTISGLNDTMTITFESAKVAGKYSNKKPGKDTFSINKAGIEFYGTFPFTATLTVDGKTMPLSDGSFVQPKEDKQVYVYKSESKDKPKVMMVIDLDKKLWSFKMSKGDTSGIDAKDGLDIILYFGSTYYGGKTISADTKIKLSYKQPKE